MSIKILFMGTPDFAVPTLSSIIQSVPDADISVISMPDKVRGRGKKMTPSPIKSIAITNDLPIYTPETKSDVSDQILAINPDLIVVVAYGMIIEKHIVDQFFCVNVHASLLPKYRGASPIQSSLLNGDTLTGITLIKLTEKMDAGAILMQNTCNILENENNGDLSSKLALLGADSCIDFIQHQFLDNNIQLIEQNHDEATYCTKIKKDDLLIDDSMSSIEIYRRIKAFAPRPAAYCIQENKRIKLLDAQLEDNRLLLQTIQPEGRSPMSYTDYLLGNPKGINCHGK